MLYPFAVTMALIVCLYSSAVAAEFNIMIVSWRGCEEACQGFQDYLVEHGVDGEFLVRDAQQKSEPLPEFLAEARAKKVDLILTWGTSVTRGIAGTLSELAKPNLNHDIPNRNKNQKSLRASENPCSFQ